MLRDPLSVLLAALALMTTATAAIAILAKRIGVLAPALVALLLRVAVGLAQYWRAGSPTSDAASYHYRALNIVDHWAGNAPPVQTVPGKEGWPYILASIYRLVGPAPELGILVNSVAGALTVIAVAAICRVLDWEVAKLPAAWIVTLWPVSVLWGTLLLREAIVTLLMATGLLGAVLIGTRRATPGFGLLLASGLPMIWMRGGLAYLILIGLPLTLTLSLTIFRPNASGFLKAIIIGAASLALALPTLSGRLASAQYFDEERTETLRRAHDIGTTGFSTAGVATENPTLAFLYAALGPFPYSWGNLGLLAAGIDAVLWIALWIFAIYGYRRLRENKWAAMLCTFPLVALLIYISVTATNFGLIMRMRAVGLPLIAPLAGYGIAMYLHSRRSRARSTPARRHPSPVAEHARTYSGAALRGN